MGSQRFVFGFIQRAIAGPNYECEISMRIIEMDKHTLRQDALDKRTQTAGQSLRRQSAHPESTSKEDELHTGLPPLRFGTVNDPISSGADAEPIPGSKATGWTTLNAPICTVFAGQMPYVSPDLLQFPIANSDGTIVMSILPVVSATVLLGVSRNSYHPMET